MLLNALQDRIKGAKLWQRYGLRRLYLPFRHADGRISMKSWMEPVADRVRICVEISGASCHVDMDWCRREEERVLELLRMQYHELINGAELSARRMRVQACFRDDVRPLYGEGLHYNVHVLKFLCGLKVGALFGENRLGKIDMAMDVARARFFAGKIAKVLVLASPLGVRELQMCMGKLSLTEGLGWRVEEIERMSRNDKLYYECLAYADEATMIIIEGSHLVKSPNTIRSRRTLNICGRSVYKLILSDIPVTEHPANLYMQYALLDARIIGCDSWEKFARQFVLLGGVGFNEIIGYKNLEYLTSLVAPYTYQIGRDNKVQPQESIRTKVCGLTDKQERHYRERRRELLGALIRDETRGIIGHLAALQQITCGFCHIGGRYRYLGTKKLDVLDSINLNGRVVFLCKYLFEVNLLAEYLGHSRSALYTGSNFWDREREMERFMTGRKQYLIATVRNAGKRMGYLPGSDGLIFFSRPFSNMYTRWLASVNHPGRSGKAFIYDIRTDSGIDELIDRSVSKKRGMESEIRSLLSHKTNTMRYAQVL